MGQGFQQGGFSAAIITNKNSNTIVNLKNSFGLFYKYNWYNLCI